MICFLYRPLLATLLCVSFASADEPQKPIRLPVIDNAEPAPVVPPQPKPVTVLPEDHFFVVESDVQLIVLHSPDGILDISEDQGPIRLRGRFAGGSGKIESKTFGGKYVYTIEGKQTKQTELVLIPVGVTSSEQIVRAVLSVNGAKPPPIPDDDKKKDEPQPEPQPAGPVRLEIIEDVLNRDVDTAKVLSALVTWDTFTDAGNEFRIYDKESTAGKMRGQECAGMTLPVLLIRDKATSKILRKMELPDTFETFKRLVSEVAGD